jgi:hypothetical protein
MRRYGGLDTSGLVATGAWKSRQAAAVYEHVEASEEAQKSDMLPCISGPTTRVKSVKNSDMPTEALDSIDVCA